MGYLDYTGLQHLWDKLKEKFAPKSHSHDDRYYTEAEMNSKLGTKASSDHTHGLNSSSLTKVVDNETTNSWDMVGGNKNFLLRSLRMQAKAPDWLEGNYAAGIAFGGSDTKGVISHAYNAPNIKFAGGNGTAPVWWLRLTGTSGKTYDLNAMPPASHTHTKDQVGLGNVDNTADANKSVKYATTAGTADKANSVDWSKVQNKPTSYPPSSHSHAYLPLGGGTISGQIKRDVGCSWIYDRDNAIVYGTSSGTSSGYHPVVGQKTPSGAWTIGTYSDERLIFDYTTDANKTAGTNKATQVYLPAQDGTIITSATIGSQSVNYAKSAGSVAWGNVTGKPGTFTPAAHTHNYAGSGSAGGSANSAVKLDSSAGGATQPVYFKDGKPVATTYSLNKTVPADAKFTDTNTWRGVQNNLTSDSTSDSLSAAQGKALKGLVDGKAPNGHTHNSVNDIGDDRTLTLAYSKDGLAYKSYLWLAGWNGNELRAVDKNQFATAEHGVTASGSNYIRFGNGTQICWGYKNESDGDKGTTSFAVAFNNTSYALALTATTKSDNAPFITGRTTTSFSYGRNGPAWDNIQWIAVGTWK